MDELAGELSLAELCAVQWKECVERALEAFEVIDETRVLRIRYESLARRPGDEALRLGAFLEFDRQELLKSSLLGEIRADSIGNAAAGLEVESKSRIRDIIEPTMQRLGYS
jgi:hypothetical protein